MTLFQKILNKMSVFYFALAQLATLFCIFMSLMTIFEMARWRDVEGVVAAGFVIFGFAAINLLVIMVTKFGHTKNPES